MHKKAGSFIYALHFPTTSNKKMRHKILWIALLRPSNAPFDALRSLAFAVAHWGQNIAAPNASKTMLNQSIVIFHTIPTRKDIETSMHPFVKAKRCAFWCITLPNVQQLIGGGTLLHPKYPKPCSLINPLWFFTHFQPKTAQKHPCMPLPRPGNASFGASPGLAFGNSLGLVHHRPQCTPNHALESIQLSFSHTSNHKGYGDIHGCLCQGQAMRLSGHHPAQRVAINRKPEYFFNFLFFLQFLIFRGGGAGGPSTVFSATHTYRCIAVLLPPGSGVTLWLHHLQETQWCCDTYMHLCGYATRMWIPPIKGW